MDPVALRLKRLREGTAPSLSVRQLAALLDMDPATYVHYESPRRFKKPFLPIDLARKLAAVMADYGIPQYAVMALAGIDPDPGDGPPLSHSEGVLLDLFRRLGANQRGALISVAEAMVATPSRPAAPEAPAPTIHQQRRDYRVPGASAA